MYSIRGFVAYFPEKIDEIFIKSFCKIIVKLGNFEDPEIINPFKTVSCITTDRPTQDPML